MYAGLSLHKNHLNPVKFTASFSASRSIILLYHKFSYAFFEILSFFHINYTKNRKKSCETPRYELTNRTEKCMIRMNHSGR